MALSGISREFFLVLLLQIVLICSAQVRENYFFQLFKRKQFWMYKEFIAFYVVFLLIHQYKVINREHACLYKD